MSGGDTIRVFPGNPQTPDIIHAFFGRPQTPATMTPLTCNPHLEQTFPGPGGVLIFGTGNPPIFIFLPSCMYGYLPFFVVRSGVYFY